MAVSYPLRVLRAFRSARNLKSYRRALSMMERLRKEDVEVLIDDAITAGRRVGL